MARDMSEGTCYISLELYFVLSHAFPIWLDDSVLPLDILNFLKHKRYIYQYFIKVPVTTRSGWQKGSISVSASA